MNIKSKLRVALVRLKIFALKCLSINDRAVSIFIAICGDYDRQSRAIVRGITEFDDSFNGKCSLYRRNIHRLEKGLVMIPRRPIFAADFIEVTVKLHQEVSKKLDSEQTSWGTDVLNMYFEVVEHGNPKVDNARHTFDIFINKRTETKASKRIPKRVVANNHIDSETFYNFVSARKSTRWFDQKEVELEKVNQAVDIASQAPSACNRQPFKFYYKKGEEAVSTAKLAMGSAGFSHNIKNLIVVVGEQGSFNMIHDRNVIYVDSSLAVMQLLLGFETMGISSCVLNWPDVKSRDIKLCKKLGLTETQRVICLVAFGYADQNCLTPHSEKKNSKELLVLK